MAKLGRQSLDGWIAEALTDEDKQGGCTQLALAHMQAGGGALEIHSVTLDAKKPRTPSMLAQLFEGKARAYAQDLPGPQMFNLLAFYGGSQDPQARHPLPVYPEPIPGGASEGANPEGFVAQVMRHGEAKETLNLKAATMLFDVLLQTNALQQRQITTLMEENQECYAIVKEVMSERALGEHDYRMKEMAYSRGSEMQKKILGAAPALINSLTGRKIFPESSVDSAIVETIAMNVSAEQIQMLVSGGVIPQELAGPLVGRLTEIVERKKSEKLEAEIAISASRAPTGENPEAQAAGDVS